MQPKQLALQIKLMSNEASDHLEAASLLSSTPGVHSNSAYLVSLIAFELLLKATLQIHGRPGARNHSYCELFASLPNDVRERIRQVAANRMSTAADYSDVNRLLFDWSRNFVSLRYPYEKYQGQTEEEYHARGDAWLAKGAPEDEADFVYHPSELHGFVFAFQRELDGWIQRAPSA